MGMWCDKNLCSLRLGSNKIQAPPVTNWQSWSGLVKVFQDGPLPFGWQSCRDTQDRFASKGMRVEEDCLPCRNAKESHQHLFFECLHSRAVWNEVQREIAVQGFLKVWMIFWNGLYSMWRGMGSRIWLWENSWLLHYIDYRWRESKRLRIKATAIEHITDRNGKYIRDPKWGWSRLNWIDPYVLTGLAERIILLV